MQILHYKVIGKEVRRKEQVSEYRELTVMVDKHAKGDATHVETIQEVLNVLVVEWFHAK